MKETFGTAFMLRMFLVIFILFFTFVCISAVYARAFRTKNGVINIIEKYEGINENSRPLIEEYIKKMGYSCYDKDNYSDVTHYVLKDNRPTIKGDIEYTDATRVDGRYNIQVCIDWDIPVVKNVGRWVINAKTEIIRNVVTS